MKKHIILFLIISVLYHSLVGMETQSTSPISSQLETLPVNYDCICYILEQLIPLKISPLESKSSFKSIVQTITNFGATCKTNRTIVNNHKRHVMRLMNSRIVDYRSIAYAKLQGKTLALLPYFQKKIRNISNKVYHIKKATKNTASTHQKEQAEKYIKKLIKQRFSPNINLGGTYDCMCHLLTPGSSNLINYSIYLKNRSLLDFFCNESPILPLEPLLCAIELGYHDLAFHLLDQNKPIDKISESKKLFVQDLYCFSDDLNFKLIKKLIKKGLNPNTLIKNSPSSNVENPLLYIAVKSKNKKMIEFLLNHGADKNQKFQYFSTLYGQIRHETPLSLAREIDDQEIIILLEK